MDIVRALLYTVEVGWGFLVMLVAMSYHYVIFALLIYFDVARYNVGLFFAILAGAFVGMLIFGRFVQFDPKSSSTSCH